MIKFSKIQNFHSVVKYGKEFIFEPVKYRGTVKLHGTNSSVICTPEELIPQSRNRQLSLDSDNAGFASFILEGKESQKAVREMEKIVRSHEKLRDDIPLVFYGEWVGPGIQNGMSINNYENKRWVIFAAKVREGESGRYLDIASIDKLHQLLWDSKTEIYSIFEAPTYELEIDFQKQESLEAAVEKYEKLTQEIEDCCPYGKLSGFEGMGEGIVWIPITKHSGHQSDLFFKTKGDKHKVVKRAQRNKSPMDPEVIESVEKFIDYAVTENRLLQGIDYLKEMNHQIEIQSMGHFLKWIGKDVQTECRVELQSNDLKWKQVSKSVGNKARDWFKKRALSLHA